MFLRVMVVLLVGIGLTGLVGAYLLAQQQAQPPAPLVVNAPPPVHIMVSARPVRAGNLIVPEDLEMATVDQDKLQPGALRDTPESRLKLRGAMMRHSLAAGDPFMPGDFLSPGDRGFLAAVLEPGMRAVTISVDAVSGTAGLVWPGDHVDVLLTQNIEDQTLPVNHRVAGSTLLENTRVIAVDQQLVQGGQLTVNGQVAANRTVTLEVSAVDLERVEVAARLGRLSLAVHSAALPPTAAGEPVIHTEPPQPVFGGDVSPMPPAHPSNKAEIATVKVFLGGGGDPVEYKFASVEDRRNRFEATTSQSAAALRNLRRPTFVHGTDHKAAKRRSLEIASANRVAGQPALPAAAGPRRESFAEITGSR